MAKRHKQHNNLAGHLHFSINWIVCQAPSAAAAAAAARSARLKSLNLTVLHATCCNLLNYCAAAGALCEAVSLARAWQRSFGQNQSTPVRGLGKPAGMHL